MMTAAYRPYIMRDLSTQTYRRGVAQPGSAPPWGGGGRRFKSSRPDHRACHPWRNTCNFDEPQPAHPCAGVRRDEGTLSAFVYSGSPSRLDQSDNPYMSSLTKLHRLRITLAGAFMHLCSAAHRRVKRLREYSAITCHPDQYFCRFFP
jgi:hypothetical protein